MKTSRRNFLTSSAIGFSSLGLIPFMEKDLLNTSKRFSKDKIIYRTLGKTGLELPVVSMGVMNANLPDLIPASYDLGIRHFDTAMGYQNGKNEEMVGTQIKELGVRDKVTIATKIVLSKPKPDKPYGEDEKKEFLKNFEGCLERLKTEYVDILYIHAVSEPSHINLNPIKDALMELKESKKVKYIGFSTHRNMTSLLNEAAKSKFYDVILTAINFTMSNDTELLKAIKSASDAGIGIVAMKTQGGGKWYRDRSPDTIKGELNATAMLKWALNVEGITTAIPGYTNFDHMNQDFSVAYDLNYTEEEKKFLKDKNVILGAHFCRQCEKCLASCPNNADIPSLMRANMYLMQYANIDQTRQALDSIDEMRNLKNCFGCSVCSAECSNYVNISERIGDLKTLFS